MNVTTVGSIDDAHTVVAHPIPITGLCRETKSGIPAARPVVTVHDVVDKGHDEAAVAESVTLIIDRIGERATDVIGSIQRHLAAEIVELRGDPALLELLRGSVAGNVETVFDALRYDISIERVEPPTAALEYARRVAQHGIPANALVRAYRLGQQQVLAVHYPWCAGWEAELRQLFAGYVAAKQREHVLDYDDLLLYWAQMMAEPVIAGDVAERFDHVLVDEYQDTNRLQAAILLGLKPNGSGLTVVGDDAQSIYSFRAATWIAWRKRCSPRAGNGSRTIATTSSTTAAGCTSCRR